MLVKNVIYHEKVTSGIVEPNFHYLDYKNGECALFDGLLNQPIIYGQKNVIDKFIRTELKNHVVNIKNIKIHYYKLMDNHLKYHRTLDMSKMMQK